MLDMKFIESMLDKKNADTLREIEVVRYFRKPPVLTRSLFPGNKLVLGVRGAGKTMLLRSLYQFFLTITLCELSTRKRITYFPVLVKPNISKNMDTASINQEVLTGLIKGINETFEDISNCNKKSEWQDKYFNIPLKQMATINDFKKFTDEYYDETTSTFKFMTNFFSEIDINGYIFSFINKSTTFRKMLSEMLNNKKIVFTKSLNDECRKFFNEKEEFIDKFVFLIDDIGTFDEFYYEENGYFYDLLEDFRKCDYFDFYLSILKNSQAEILAQKNPAFNSHLTISYNLQNREEFIKTRLFIKELLQDIFNTNKLEELIEIFDEPYENEDIEITEFYGDAFEQLIYASRGLPRWIFQILQKAIADRKDAEGTFEPLEKEEIISAIKYYAFYTLDVVPQYAEHRSKLTEVCKSSKTFKFYANRYNTILKNFTYNTNNDPIILTEGEKDFDNREFAFHYAYCVWAGLPTHEISTHNIDEHRSIITSDWINRKVGVEYLNEQFIQSGEE